MRLKIKRKFTVNVQLEQLVGLVDGDLDLSSELEDTVVVGRVRVDHDRVGVAVDDFEVHLLNEVFRLKFYFVTY